MTKIYYLAGYIRSILPAYTGSLEWVRDLTGDGDIEANPGPISVDDMSQLEGATDIEKLCNQPMDIKWPIQHWAHHHLTKYTGKYSEHFGDLENMLIPTYNTQASDETLVNNVPLPLRETQLFPRTIPLAERDDGKQAVRHREVEWRLNLDGGVPLPGIEMRLPLRGPGEQHAPDRYDDGDGELLDPQPADDEGRIDRLRIWPPRYQGAPVSVREFGVRGDRPLRMPADAAIHDRIWDALDGDYNDQIIYGHMEFDEEVEGDFIHTFQSGCPVLFFRADRYHVKYVPNLKDSNYTLLIHSKLNRTTTVIPHRPELLLKGYRRYDIENYILNWKGLDDVRPAAFGGEDRLRLDMTMFSIKLSLFMGWWSLNDTTVQRGVSLAGQTQVTTPWVSPMARLPYRCVLNQSPIVNENCGRHDAPGFPSPDGINPRT